MLLTCACEDSAWASVGGSDVEGGLGEEGGEGCGGYYFRRRPNCTLHPQAHLHVA